MNPRQSSKSQKGKLDSSKLIRLLLQFEDYWRLMALLFALGLLSGAGYFVYARATFESTALIRINQFVDAAKAASGAQRDNNIALMRSLSKQLTSDFYQLEAAKKLGVATASTTAVDLRPSLIPAIRIGFLDQSHIQLRVISYRPRIVREFPQAMIEAYEGARKRLRNEYRDKAIARYVDELADVRAKVTSQLDSRLKFEEESALASAQIELERLSDVPVQQVRVRYKLQEMDGVRQVLKDQGGTLDTVGTLALLTSMTSDKDDPLSVGRIVRRTGDPRTSAPATFQTPEMAKEYNQIVVQPDMVEGIEPWRELDKKKRSLEEKMAQSRAKFLDDHPEMIKLREELRETVSALELELQVARRAFDLEYEKLKEQLVELEAKLPDYYKAAKSYDEKKLAYELMEKGQLAWDKAYEQLSRQIEGLEFGSDESAVSLEFRGFTDIRSEAPVSPNKSKLLMLGCLLGLGMAGGVPFLLKQMDSTVTDLNEFEETLGIPGIGLVPLTDPEVLEEVNRSQTVGSKVPNALLENFRLIRSSILLNRSPMGEARVIMLTSARPGEGKTTVSANVAWAFSSMGEKTLLIDCDLRRGRVHNVAGVPNLPGLTRLLTGQATLEECLVKSPAENLWLLPRGQVIAGTTELLNTEVFSQLLDSLRKQFSRIILDTPPVLGLSETAFLQNHADGVVLVVRSASTPRSDVTAAFQQLEKLGGHFFGFVLNRVDFSKRSNHYDYYYYSSNYYDSNWEEEEKEDREADERPGRKKRRGSSQAA